jgi:hypothetical protein
MATVPARSAHDSERSGAGTGGGDATSAAKGGVTPTTLTWRVRALAAGYFALFLAYSGTQLLQSSINGSAGFWCLGVLYALFAVSALIAPWIVARTPSFVIIPASAALYVVMVAANIRVHPVPLVLSCAGVGLAASTLWSAQGVFIGKCANAYAAATGTPLTVATSQLNASFYTIFASAGAFSAAFSSILLLSMRNAIGPLFIVLTVVGVAAVAWLMCVADAGDPSLAVMKPQAIVTAWRAARNACRGGRRRDPALVPTAGDANVRPTPGRDDEAWDMRPVQDGRPADSGEPRGGPSLERTVASPPPAAPPTAGIPSLSYMVSFLAQRRLMRLMMPILAVSGLSNGVFNGVWFASLARPLVGLDYVGFVGASYAAASSLSTRVFGQLAKRPAFGRRWSMAIAAALQAVFLCGSTVAYMVLWVDGSPSDALLAMPHGARLTVLCLAAALYGVGDAVWFSQLPATLQTFFPVGKDAPCAMASIRFYFSIGFALSSALSLLMAAAVAAQLMFQCVCLGCAVACLWYMHRFVQSIDAAVPGSSTDGHADKLDDERTGGGSVVVLSSVEVSAVPTPANTPASGDAGAPWEGDGVVRKRSTSRGEA